VIQAIQDPLASVAQPATAMATGMTRQRNLFNALVEIGRTPDAQDPQIARQAATQLLSELFFKPLLAEMRKFPLGRDVLHGGQMEDAFGQQLDQRMADAVAGSASGLADQLLQQLSKIAPAAAAAKQPADVAEQAKDNAAGGAA
jgi:Rod binding domain-containing protein